MIIIFIFTWSVSDFLLNISSIDQSVFQGYSIGHKMKDIGQPRNLKGQLKTTPRHFTWPHLFKWFLIKCIYVNPCCFRCFSFSNAVACPFIHFMNWDTFCSGQTINKDTLRNNARARCASVFDGEGDEIQPSAPSSECAGALKRCLIFSHTHDRCSWCDKARIGIQQLFHRSWSISSGSEITGSVNEVSSLK